MGIPGLIHAYKTSAKEALSVAKMIEKAILVEYKIECSFELMPELMNYLKKNQAVFLEQTMTDKLFLRFEIEKNKEADLYEKWKLYLV